MQWEFIVALVLAVPVILFPVAFIWYINVSGLYQVMRDARQRQKIRARAFPHHQPRQEGRLPAPFQ